jgi:hypothetical protein
MDYKELFSRATSENELYRDLDNAIFHVVKQAEKDYSIACSVSLDEVASAVDLYTQSGRVPSAVMDEMDKAINRMELRQSPIQSCVLRGIRDMLVKYRAADDDFVTDLSKKQQILDNERKHSRIEARDCSEWKLGEKVHSVSRFVLDHP